MIVINYLRSLTGDNNNETMLEPTQESGADRALSIELIRAKILFHALGWKVNDEEQDKYGRQYQSVVLDPKEVKTLRLVNSDWMDTLTRVLRKESDPLCFIGKDRSTDTSVEDFVRQMLTSDLYPMYGENRLIAPFGLRLYCHFFKQANQQTLTDCLTKLGSGLRTLRFYFPVDATLSLETLEHLHLPRLERLVVFLTELTMRGNSALRPGDYQANGQPVPTRDFQELLQLILNASPKLTLLKFTSCSYEDGDDEDEDIGPWYFPRNFVETKLPASLRQIDFESRLGSPRDLGILLAPQNSLSNLNSLSLYAWETPFDTEMLHQILEKVSPTLRHLCLEGTPWGDDDIPAAQQTTILNLPRLPMLRGLRVTSPRWNLPIGVSHLVNRLPLLEYLALRSCVGQEFMEKWTHLSVYPSVRKVSLFLVAMRTAEEVWEELEEEEIEDENGMEADEENAEEPQENEEWDEEVEADDEMEGTDDEGGDDSDNGPRNRRNAIYVANGAHEDEEEEEEAPVFIALAQSTDLFPACPLNLEEVQKIRTTFPNLTALHLSLDASGGPGLAHVFVEFPQLTSLDLRMTNGGPPTNTFWDELLTGLSQVRVNQLRKLLLYLETPISPELSWSEEDVERILTSVASSHEARGIFRMTQLKHLLLACTTSPLYDSGVISDLSFHLGFFKLPLLKKLELGGGFQPNAGMRRRWSAKYENQPEKLLLCYPSYVSD